MPITLQINHPDRMAIGVMRGVVTGEDLYNFTAELAAAGAARYRKIIDVIGHTVGLTRLMGDERPVRVFRGIHAVREWLQANTEYPDRMVRR